MRKRTGGARWIALTAALLIVAAVVAALLMSDRVGSAPTGQPPTFSESELASLEIPVRRLYDRTLGELRAEPNSPARWAALGMTYEANGRLDLALPCYQRAVDMDGGQAKWWYRLAQARHEAGEHDEAEKAIDRVIVLQSDYAPAHWRAGLWLLESGRLDEARAALVRAAEIDPADPVPQLGLARVHLQRGEPRQAQDILQMLLSKGPGGPYADHAQRLLAAALRAQGMAGGMPIAGEAGGAGGAKALPEWSDPWTDELNSYRRTFLSLIKLAQQLVEAGNLERAVTLYRQLLAMQPGQMQVMADLGRVLVDAGQTAEGFAMLQDALRRHPNYYMIYFNLAQSCEREARRKDAEAPALRKRALDYLDRTVQLNPNFAAAYGLKAEVLARGGRLAEAIDSAHLAARNDAGNPQWLYRAGTWQLQLQRWNEAATDLEQVTNLSPGHGEALAALGWARLQMGELDAADKALQRAAKLRPGDPTIAAAIQELQKRRGAGQP